MLTKTQEEILAYLLSHPDERLTNNGTAKKLGKSYTLVYNNIAALEKKGIIKKEEVPPAQIITINEFAPSDILIDIEFKIRNDFLQKYPQIKVMLDDILSAANSHFFILLVFGSYAKGTETAKSDLDLLVIVQDKKHIKKIESTIQRSYSKTRKSVNFADLDDFREMIRNSNELNIGNEAKKHHVILFGIEEYYQLIR